MNEENPAQNPAKDPARLSIPLRGGRSSTEEELIRHSFDLLLFPRYLERNMAERVSVVVRSNSKKDPDLMALYKDAQSKEHHLYAHLKADEQGVLTDSDDLYRAIHAAFEAHVDVVCDKEGVSEARYIGFTRCGRPPYAPLFALAILYQKYGKGLYKAGDMLPTPWPSLMPSYRMTKP